MHVHNSKKIFLVKLLLLKGFESATKWLYPKHVSGQVLRTADKSGYIGLFQKLMIASEKKIFFLGADEYLERLEGKIRKHLFFYVQIF